MSTGRGTPSDYDWEDGADPQTSEPVPLPSRAPSQHTPLPGVDPDGTLPPHSPSTPDPEGPYGAPSFSYDAPDRQPEERRERRLPAWAILAMVAVQGAAAVAIVALVLGAAQNLFGRQEPGPTAAPPTATAPATRAPTEQETDRVKEPGTVTDGDGQEVTDGTGGYDDPATIGEHTVTWNVWTGGTLSVTPHAVDLDATPPAASGKDMLQDGYRLVLVEYEVRYDGTGRLAPAEELWLTGESDRTYFPDIGEGIVPDPMKRITPLASGQSARFHSAFLVPESEVDTFRLGVETFSGEILYFGTE